MKQTFGIIVSTRSFFPSHLVKTARDAVTSLLDRLGYDYIMVGENDTQYGAIVTYQEAKVCAELFKANREKIDGIIVIMPNFFDELGMAEAIEQASLNVPILIQACDDDFGKLDMPNRRDAVCGKISLCNNLYQRNIHYTLTKLHTCPIDSPEFAEDVVRFAGICRVVNGMKGSRIAMLGTRPIAFNTVRYSEKILQKHGISVQTVDFSEIIIPMRRRSMPRFVKSAPMAMWLPSWTASCWSGRQSCAWPFPRRWRSWSAMLPPFSAGTALRTTTAALPAWP